MNVLIIKNPYNSDAMGGGEIHTFQLANFLKKRGHSVFFMGSCPWMTKKLKEANVPCFSFGNLGEEAVSEGAIINFLLKQFKWKKQWQEKILEMKNKYNIDCLYLICFNEKILLTKYAKKLGMKVVWVEHRLMGRWFQLNPLRGSYVTNAFSVDKIVAVSQAVKTGLRIGGVPNSKIALVYNGIEYEKFSNIKRKKHRGFVVGTIARLADDKGVDYLIEAFSKLSKKVENSKLRIVGGGPLEKSLKMKAEKMGLQKQVIFEGYLERDAVYEFLSGIDVFCLLPTRGESFGLVFAEAGASGLPCVAARIGGVAEVVKDEETGKIVPPKNPSATAKALIAFAKDKNLRNEFGKNARKRVKELFNINNMLEAYAKIIEK